jgi:FAD/FMN-containing dehydrogenase
MEATASPSAPSAIPTERLIRPGDAAYDEARQVWNGMISHRPAVIARVESAGEVVAAIALARAEGLPISIRGGGHNVAGLAVGDGALVVDLAGIAHVDVDPVARRARVGAGARWKDLDAAAQAHGLATPGGVVSDTGIAGLTLSGGLGWLRRKHGLSCDALRAATLVTADGRIVRASADDHPDLFWGLRGGGGNFGVVTELEFELFPLGPTVATTVAIWPLAEAAARLRDLRDLVPSLPDEVSPVAVLSPVPDDEAFPGAIRGGDALFILALAATPVDEGATLLRPIADLGDGAAVDVGGPAPYVEFQQFFDADYPAHTMRYYWKSSFADDLPDALIDELVDAFARRPSHHSTIDIWVNGGAIARVPADDSAFGQRAAPWLISPESNWESADDDAANLAWGRDIVARVGGSAYLNFPGLLEAGDRDVQASHGRTFDRLAKVKRAWDPDNVFRFNANIAPAPRD